MKPINIITFLAATLFSIGALAAGSGKNMPRGDGRLAISNYHEQKYAEITYRHGNAYIPEGLRQIENALRSRDKKTHPIDKRLIELIDHLQDHFGAETIEIISGYRSSKYNRSLRMEGRGAASESLHTKGVACDIHLDEIREKDLFEYAKSLGIGGVGYYPRYAFVHVDVGPARTWQEAAASKRILIGTENNPNILWTAITDKNIYGRENTVDVVITNEGYERQRFSSKKVWLERFRRGEWSEHRKIKVKGRGRGLPVGATANISWRIPEDQPFGKYRIAIFPGHGEDPAYSNEFYIKKPY